MLPALPLLCAGFAGAAYAIDVLARPQHVAKQAIEYARSRQRPIINLGSGTPGSSLRTMLFGPTLWGDVNIDIAAPKDSQCGPNTVCHGDAQDLRSRWPYKHFGSAIASHCLEHVPDPIRMMKEMEFIAERVYLIVPSVYAPHSLLYPDHKWQIEDRTACSLIWNKQYPAWTCFKLPYSISNAMQGDFR